MVEETKQESKKEEETSTQESSTEEQNSDNSKLEEDESKKPEGESKDDEPKEKSGVDYEEQLRIAQEKLDKAENKIVKMKKKKKDDVEDDFEEEDERFSKLEDKFDKLQSTLTQNSSKDVIDKYASNEAESKLIQFHLDNSIKLSGDLEADVRRAKAIANESRLIETNKELANAVKQKSTVSTGDSSGHKTEKEKTVSGLSERDINHLKSRGLWEKYVEEHGE